MSFFKPSISVREQLEQSVDHQQIQKFETELLQRPIESSTDVLRFSFWLENPSFADHEIRFALSNLEWFLIRTKNNEIAYGGNQYWWKNKHFYNAGCGTVAACNIVYYIARYSKQMDLLRQPKLLTDQLINQDEFLEYMEDMVQYLTPTCEGIPVVSYFQTGCEKYIESVGYPEPKWFVFSASNETEQSIFEAAKWIAHHIKANRPIACLHWFHVGHMRVFNPMEAKESFTDMNWHWVTITELYQQQEDWKIVVSSCGLRYELDFFHFLKGEPAFITADIKKQRGTS